MEQQHAGIWPFLCSCGWPEDLVHRQAEEALSILWISNIGRIVLDRWRLSVHGDILVVILSNVFLLARILYLDKCLPWALLGSHHDGQLSSLGPLSTASLLVEGAYPLVLPDRRCSLLAVIQ